MVTKDGSLTTGIICWIVFHFIILPYEGYWLFKFWKDRDALIIKKRKPMLVVVATVCLWIYMLLQFTHSFISWQFMSWNNNIPVSAPVLIRSTLYQPLIWSYLIIHSARYWLMFYMINYNAAVVNNKWQSIIDPKQCNTNWYIQNKTKWGSWKYIRKWTIAYGIMVYSMVNFLYILSLRYYDSDTSSFYIINIMSLSTAILFLGPVPITFNVYMLCKIPAFDDDIGIRKELKFSIYSLSTIIAVVIMFQIITTIIYVTGHYGHYVSAVSAYIYFLVLRLAFLISIARNTRWPLVRFKEIVSGRHSSSRIIELVHQKTYAALDAQSLIMKDNEEDIALRKEMKDTLQNDGLFDAFMLHLLSEYCGECLLSIIEFTQFKEKIVAQNKDIGINQETGSVFKLPDDLVKSNIVYGAEDGYKDIAHKLYNKYVRTGSALEINIDSHNRNRYKDMFEYGQLTGDTKELYTLFDPCIDHMIALITSSFTRFKHSKKYQLIQQYSPPTVPNKNRLNILKLIPAISASEANHTNIIHVIDVEQSVLIASVEKDENKI